MKNHMQDFKGIIPDDPDSRPLEGIMAAACAGGLIWTVIYTFIDWWTA